MANEELAEKMFTELRLGEENSSSLNIDSILARVNEIFESIMEDEDRPSGAAAYADTKSNKEAELVREAAIASFKEGDPERALALLARSLALAPEGSESLAKAYDGRSFVLFRQGRYEASVMDANRALKGNCPKSLSQRLRDRKMKCIVEYRRTNGRAIKAHITDPEELKDANDKDDAEWRALCRMHPRSSILPNTSSKVELKPKNGGAWTVAAAEDIQPGEVLSVEEHYVMALHRKNRFTHCAYCLIRCDTLIPCPSCTQTLYCSRKCRETAYDSYHRTECRMIKFYDRQLPDGRESMAMQAFLRGTKQGRALPTLMAKLKPRDIFKTNFLHQMNKPFPSHDYITILTACGSFDDVTLGSKINEVLFEIVEAIIALRELSFFPRNDNCSLPDRLSEAELFAALLLMNNLVSIGKNHFKVVEETPISSENTHPLYFDEDDIGCCFYVLMSFLTNSCNPNTHVIIKNRQRVLYATRPIKAGEKLFYSAKHLFALMPKEERQEMFMQRGFVCRCEACLNDWPCLPGLFKLGLRPLEKNGIEELLGLLDAEVYAIRKERPLGELTKGEIRRLIISYLKLLATHLETKPSFELFHCESMLVRAMKAFYSDHHQNNSVITSYLEESFVLLDRCLLIPSSSQ